MDALNTLELELNETVTRLWERLNSLARVPMDQRDELWKKTQHNADGQLMALQAVRARINGMLQAQDEENVRTDEFNEKMQPAPVGWAMVEGDEPAANNDFALDAGDESPLFASS